MRYVGRSMIHLNEWLLVYLSSLIDAPPPTSCDCSGCTIDGDGHNDTSSHWTKDIWDDWPGP